MKNLPVAWPDVGLGEDAVYAYFEATMDARSAKLGSELAFAHMDPPTPKIAAQLAGLNAQLNQNLLHPSLSPFATEAEAQVIAWLGPEFGMQIGHMCAGSSIANLTALWGAREKGAKRVVASRDAHLSVAKAAHILGLPFEAIDVDAAGRLDRGRLADVADAALVLTAGTTGRGAIDALDPIETAWLHVDAAWAGPLRFTRYADRLDGIERADSIAISAHKWLYQPKESALILFRDPDAHRAISFGGAYLASPNVGVQGSRGAAAIPLLATLIAIGRAGLAARIEKNMADAETLYRLLEADPRTEVAQPPQTAIFNWRPRSGGADGVIARLEGTSSRTIIDGEPWVRQVAANPNADVTAIWRRIDGVLSAM